MSQHSIKPSTRPLKRSGHVALITGSTSGIGKAAAAKFLEEGYSIVIHGKDSKRTAEVFKEFEDKIQLGQEVIYVCGDLREEKTIKLLIDKTIATFGRLDVLVNNAGLFKPANMNDGMKAYEVYSDMIKVNLDQVVMLTLLAAPYLRDTNGCVVNISSNLHKVCLNGSFAYSAAKAGLTMFTKSAAVDLAPHVRVNSISPGPVATMMSTRNGQDIDSFRRAVGSSCLTGRVGEPEDVARMVIFLSSPESRYITGSDFIIDGGSTIKPAGKLMSQD